MPKTRQPSSKKKFQERKTRPRKNQVMRLGPLSLPNLRAYLRPQKYWLKQQLAPTTITSSTTVTTFTATNFTFSSLDQVNNLTAIFDQYRFAKVRVEWLPQFNDNNTVTVDTGSFATVVDFDDNTALASYNSAVDYSNCIQSSGYTPHVVEFVPCIAVAAYAGAFSSFANQPAPWIDTASSGVQHYGVKTAWTVTSSVITYRQQITLWMEFQNVPKLIGVLPPCKPLDDKVNRLTGGCKFGIHLAESSMLSNMPRDATLF
jgi:hypothetical protein